MCVISCFVFNVSSLVSCIPTQLYEWLYSHTHMYIHTYIYTHVYQATLSLAYIL